VNGRCRRSPSAARAQSWRPPSADGLTRHVGRPESASRFPGDAGRRADTCRRAGATLAADRSVTDTSLQAEEAPARGGSTNPSRAGRRSPGPRVAPARRRAHGISCQPRLGCAPRRSRRVVDRCLQRWRGSWRARRRRRPGGWRRSRWQRKQRRAGRPGRARAARARAEAKARREARAAPARRAVVPRSRRRARPRALRACHRGRRPTVPHELGSRSPTQMNRGTESSAKAAGIGATSPSAAFETKNGARSCSAA
jgi:hypothetical protein